jgi:hypothetical protein
MKLKSARVIGGGVHKTVIEFDDWEIQVLQSALKVNRVMSEELTDIRTEVRTKKD